MVNFSVPFFSYRILKSDRGLVLDPHNFGKASLKNDIKQDIVFILNRFIILKVHTGSKPLVDLENILIHHRKKIKKFLRDSHNEGSNALSACRLSPRMMRLSSSPDGLQELRVSLRTQHP